MHLLSLSPAQAMLLYHPQDAIYRIQGQELSVSVAGIPFIPSVLPHTH